MYAPTIYIYIKLYKLYPPVLSIGLLIKITEDTPTNTIDKIINNLLYSLNVNIFKRRFKLILNII